MTACSVRTLQPNPVTKVGAEIEATPTEKCIDTLAGVDYPNVVRSIPNDIWIGLFADTFGDAIPLVESELSKGRVGVRVNLLWSDSHQYGEKDLQKVVSQSRRLNLICAKYPKRVEIAPFTEHNVVRPEKYLEAVRANAPNCSYPVNTPWNGSLVTSDKFKNEIHGTAHANPNVLAGGWNYSDDGTNSVDTDVKAQFARRAGADRFCLWHPRLNKKWSMKDTTPRNQRKALPTVDFMQSLVYLFTPKGPVSIPKGWLPKSHADNHGPGPGGIPDPKGDKLLIISPLRFEQRDNKGKVSGYKPIVLKRSGKVLGELKYYGTFDGGGYRYYAPQMGYKYGAAVEIWLGGKYYGVFNGGFRAGSFR